MYDYMKALQLRFSSEPQRSPEMKKLYEELKEKLDRDSRKLLLRLWDMEDEYCEGVAMENFVAGWCVASGIAEELKSKSYSFAEEEEKNAIRKMREEETYGKTQTER